MDLDRFDCRLLTLLQENNLRTYDDLAAELGLSATAVRRRARLLRQNGVITRDVAIVDPAKFALTVIVSIRFEKESHATYQTFKAKIKLATEISQCYTVSGDVDFIIVGHFADLKTYDEWVGTYLLSDPNIARSTTNVVYTRVKFETAVRFKD